MNVNDHTVPRDLTPAVAGALAGSFPAFCAFSCFLFRPNTKYEAGIYIGMQISAG